MTTERRRHARKPCGFIVDYQSIERETEGFDKRAKTVNISPEGMCLHSSFRENCDNVLLLQIPYITPNPGIIAARVKHVSEAPSGGYYHGLFVLPLFRERFAVVDTMFMEKERIDILLDNTELNFINEKAGNEKLAEPLVLGICRFFADLNPKVTDTISSFDDLKKYLKKEIEHRNKGDR
jgi:hypothetical protein